MTCDCIGKNIQYYRKQRGLTQEQLAEAVEVSVQAIRNIENSINSVTIENFVRICKVLCVPSDFILADADMKFKIGAVAQKWEYLANLDAEKFRSIAKQIEFVYDLESKMKETQEQIMNAEENAT